MGQQQSSELHHEPGRFWSGLTWPKQTFAILKQMLSNETDMAFRRRAFVLLSYLNPQSSDKILECGCGRGFYLNMIRAVSDCELTGVELDPECLAIANAQLSTKQVKLLDANIESLPFPSESFSKILFTEVIEHIPNDRLALSEIYRVLKPGGILALSTPNADYPFLWDPINWTLEALRLNPIRTGIFSGIWANHERLYKEDHLLSLVREAGFQVLDKRPITYFCFPFAHNIVYGIGKELLIRGFLPKNIANASDRFAYEKNSGSLVNPVNLMRWIFQKIDKLNDHHPVEKRSLLHALQLKKPD